MKKSRFTEEQIAYLLRRMEPGTPVADVCRGVGISGATVYGWKQKYASPGVTDLRELKQLVNEHASPATKIPALHTTRPALR